MILPPPSGGCILGLELHILVLRIYDVRKWMSGFWSLVRGFDEKNINSIKEDADEPARKTYICILT
jgi:hypothetical protein